MSTTPDIEKLQLQINALKRQLDEYLRTRQELVNSYANDRESIFERLDQIEIVQHQTKRNTSSITRNVRVMTFTLICVIFLLFIAALFLIDVSDGKIDNAGQIFTIVQGMSGIVGGLSIWVVTGRADRLLK